MSTEPFGDILKRFDELSPEERERLFEQLEERQTTGRNTADSTRTLYDAFNERGLIGSIRDAPPDWSSNPKYMEGFGKGHDAE